MDLTDIRLCDVVGCRNEADGRCEAHRRMFICPHCHQECRPYLDQSDWYRPKDWNCDKCDRWVPEYVPPVELCE